MRTFKSIAFVLLAASSSAHAAFTLPAFDPLYAGVNGDFITYSLPLLQFVVEGDSNLGPGDTYHVKSTPGELSKPGEYVVIGTFPAGPQDNSDVSTLIDNAYELANGGSANSVAFSTFDSGTVDVDLNGSDDGLPDPGGAGQFAGDLQDSWDANLGALVGFSGSTDLIVMFNFNEANSDRTIFGTQFLQAWAHVWLTELDGDHVAGSDFYLTGTDIDGSAKNPLGPDPSDFFNDDGDPIPDGDPSDDTDILDPRNDWANSFGAMCIDPDLDMGSNPGCGTINPDVDGDDLSFNHNLGADQAAYALTSPGLNSFIAGLGIANLSNYVLHVDWRARFGDNGYEQAFLVSSEFVPTPEPATLGLVGAGLILVGGAWARRNGKGRQA